MGGRSSSIGVDRRTVLRGLMAAPSAAVASCLNRPQIRGRLYIATGGRGGVYFRLGEGIAQAAQERYPEWHTKVLETAASTVNVEMVNSGRVDVGFTQADVLVGTGLALPLALSRLHDDYLHLVVRADGPLRSLPDLRRRRVSLGATGSGTEVTAHRLFSVAGMSADTEVTNMPLSVDESTAALAESRIAAFFFSGGLPVAATASLSTRTEIRLLPLGQYVPALRRRYGEVYVERTIPASTYGIDPVTTVAVPNFLVASATMPESMAYALAELLMGRRKPVMAAHPAAERFNRRTAIATDPLALHPGAVRYFRESKP